MDVTPDGRYLLIVDREPVSVTRASQNTTLVSGVGRLDLATGAVTTFTSSNTAYYPDAPYYDVVVAANGTALLSHDFYGSGWTPITRLNVDTGLFVAETGDSYSQTGVFTRAPDRSEVLFGPQNISKAPLFVLDETGTVVADRETYQDNISGFNRGVQAISASGDLIAQAIGPIYIFDTDLNLRLNLSSLHPYFDGVVGMTFSLDGSRLFVLDAEADAVFELSKDDFSVIRGFGVGTRIDPNGSLYDATQYGDRLQISPDGRTLSVIGEVAVQAIDLGLVQTDRGSSGNDRVFGDADRETFYGFGGNDTIDSGGGGDSLFGGAGDDGYFVRSGDVVTERAGEGYYRVFSRDDFTISAQVEVLAVAAGIAAMLTGDDTIYTLEGAELNDTLFGLGGRDVLIGNGGNDVLDGGTGNDRLIGGTGDDTAFVDSRGDLVFEDSGGGVDTVITDVGFYLYANIENLTLAPGADFGVGNELTNTLTGNAGDNLLIGGAGDDTLRGMGGADALFGEAGRDVLDGGDGIDALVGGGDEDQLFGGAEADALHGGDGADSLYGGFDFATDIMIGGAGNDLLSGDSGLGDYDLMDGGVGDDIYSVDTSADLTFEAVGGGIDHVYARGPGLGVYLWANVENLTLSIGSHFGVGNELDNVITGSEVGRLTGQPGVAFDGGNLLLGGAGDDTIDGATGDDVLFGGDGRDVFVFSLRAFLSKSAPMLTVGDINSGRDLVGDFAPGVDRLDVSGLTDEQGAPLFEDFADVQARLVEYQGSSAINLANGGLIVIAGVTNAQLSSADFIFG